MIRTLIVLAALLWPMAAQAHTASRSFSAWTADDATLTATFETDARRATQLPEAQARADGDLAAALAAHLAGSVTVRQAGAACSASAPTPLGAEPGQIRVQLAFRCPAPIAATKTTLRVTAFLAASPTHVHYLRFDAGERHIEDALTTRRTTLTLDPAAAAPSGFLGFVVSGAEHVLGGLDHVAFLLALALLAGRAWAAVLAATGFTIGHSITLSLVALGLIRPHEAGIEALIGFTIAFAAAEALRGKGGRNGWAMPAAAALAIAAAPLVAAVLGFAPPPLGIYLGAAVFTLAMAALPAGDARRLTPLLAALFGLAHGAGFAGALTALDLPRERLVGALLGFNLGVELGQLAALAGFALIAAVIARAPPIWRDRAAQATAAALLALGAFWFTQRTFLPAFG
jgi:hypothetical protein